MKLTFVACMYYLSMALTYGQTLMYSKDLIKYGFVTTSINQVLTEWPDQNISVISTDHYSAQQRSLQHKINNYASTVVTQGTQNDSTGWTNIDKEEITPSTWRWIDLMQVQLNGDTTHIALRRPTWWMRESGIAEKGDQVTIDLPEVGIYGNATVTNIRANQFDSRFLSSADTTMTISPITGKFVYFSNDVYDLYFEEQPQPVGVTGNHPFWSVDRNVWIPAGELMIGERVKSIGSICKLKERKKRNGIHQVYNLEVYRSHNYFVSSSQILVHNICVLDYLKSNVKKMVFGKRYVLFGDKYGDLLLSNSANNHMARRGFGVGAVQGFGMTNKTVVQALDKTVERGDEILMILEGVDIGAARRGFVDFDNDASAKKLIAEWELSIILRNKKYYDNTKVTVNGEVVPISQVEGLEYIGSN